MVENYHKGLELLQKEIQARGTKFLHGDEPGLVDYTIWPFLERFEALPLLGKADFAIDKSKYEVLVSNLLTNIVIYEHDKNNINEHDKNFSRKITIDITYL